MGMRMMFTMFLLVVLATAVVSYTSDRGPTSDGGNAAAKAFDLMALIARDDCCLVASCWQRYPERCGGGR
uniref:A superfamily conotoxin Co1.6 n=1 Tax=Conus coronatus TaxID=89441 RepID=S4UJD3_CONCS|nr:A superfamily conotoxin Co1.6 precursor [Conus coronatus]